MDGSTRGRYHFCMWTLLALITSVSNAADFELSRPSDYNIEGYWEYGFGLATVSATEKYTDNLDLSGLEKKVEKTFTGYGPQFEIKRGATLDDATFFELGGRVSYFAAGGATYKDELLQQLTATPRDHLTIEFLLGGGYTMTYTPARWYAHLFSQSLKTGTVDPNFGNPGSGFRVGLGYYFNLSTSVALEYSSVTNTVAYKNLSNQTRYATYPMSMLALNFTFNSPTASSTEPWKKKYQKLSDE